MRIHFCDLCNESVPQSDLDEGRAFVRKGRVICASCDRSMSLGLAGAAGPFSKEVEAGTAAAPGAAVAEGRSDGGLRGTAAPAPAAAPAAYAPAPGYPPVALARARGGSSAGLGLVALLVTGGLAFWVGGRLNGLESELTSSTLLLRDAQDDARVRVDQELSAQAQRAAEQGDRLAGEVRELREWLNAELASGEQRARQVEDRLTAFGQRIDSMSESFGNVNRHDQELVFLQQRYSVLEADVQALGERFAALERRGPSAPPPEAAPLAAAPEETGSAPPPWMGLVEDLASPNTSERWQAVMALGDTRDPAVSEFLLPALRDEDIFIRMVTARVLGDLGSPLGIPALIDALDDSETAVREAAYLALRALTKRDFPFDHVTEDQNERARRIKVWREWWEKEKPRYLEG